MGYLHAEMTMTGFNPFSVATGLEEQLILSKHGDRGRRRRLLFLEGSLSIELFNISERIMT